MTRAEKHLAIVTHRRLDEDRSGSKTYLRRMMSLALEAGYRLSILCLPATTFSSRPWGKISDEFSRDAAIHWPGTWKLGETYWSLSPSVWSRFGWRLLQEGFRRTKLGPESWRTPRSNLGTVPTASEQASIIRKLKTLQPDAVLVEYSSLGPILEGVDKGIGKALLVHDSFAARAEHFRAQGLPPDYPATPSYAGEAERMSSADVIFHASVKELERFKQESPHRDHIWFRPTAPVLRDRVAERPQAELLYIGANQKGSRDAISHFIQDIWPAVVEAVPTARLNIVGTIGNHIDPRLITDGITVHGRVDNLSTFAGPDMIGLLPTRLMSGISIKVGEYLGMGVPI
ncbi:MAG: glycosyltransferase family 4 protein, partial [Pseudomonadota bacterium]